jgi:tetratricopeptide (TPR) repeat protein
LNRGEEIALAEAVLWCDAAAFEDKLEEGRLQTALELYRGEFLRGFHLSGCGDFERWLEETRARLRQRAVAGAWQLSDELAEAGNGAKAVKWAEWVMALIPTDEGAFQRLAVLLDRLGDRSNALQAYNKLVERLRVELEVEPSPETSALISRIRARQDDNGSEPPSAPAAIPIDEQIVSPQTSNKTPPRLRLAVLSLIAVVSATVLIALRDTQVQPTIDSRRVAVTRLENRTGDPSLDAMGYRAMVDIAQGLAATGLVEVATTSLSAGSHMQREATDRATVHDIAELTGAGIVLLGSYSSDGDTVHFEVEAVDADDSELIGLIGPIVTSSDSTVNALEELRQRAMGLVAVLFTDVEPYARPFGNQTYPPPRYDAYQEYLAAFDETRLRLESRYEYSARAVARDSLFVKALFFPALNYILAGEYERADSLLSLFKRSRDRLSRADIEFVYGLEALRWNNWGLAYRHMRRAAVIDAAWANFHAYTAFFTARYRETVDVLLANGIEGLATARQSNWKRATAALHFLGEHENELRIAREGTVRYPNYLWFSDMEATALVALGRLSELRELVNKALSTKPAGFFKPQDLLASVGEELLLHGHTTEALSHLERAAVLFDSLARVGENPGPLPVSPRMLIELGRTEETREMLVNLSSTDDPGLALHLRMLSGDTTSLRADAAMLDKSHVKTAAGLHAMLGVAEAQLGDSAAAWAAWERLGLLDRPEVSGIIAWHRAAIMDALGECERMVSELRAALQTGQLTPDLLHRWIVQDCRLDPGFLRMQESRG